MKFIASKNFSTSKYKVTLAEGHTLKDSRFPNFIHKGAEMEIGGTDLDSSSDDQKAAIAHFTYAKAILPLDGSAKGKVEALRAEIALDEKRAKADEDAAKQADHAKLIADQIQPAVLALLGKLAGNPDLVKKIAG